jgi:hypothetical protein
MAWRTVSASSPGKEMSAPFGTGRRMSWASGAYRVPPQSGQGMSTSGRNWTSSEI